LYYSGFGEYESATQPQKSVRLKQISSGITEIRGGFSFSDSRPTGQWFDRPGAGCQDKKSGTSARE
jgi:hypothetical protein